MKSLLVGVVEAARALGLRRTARGVSAAGTPAEFAERLSALLEALERLDRAGSASAEPVEARMARGMDALVRWVADSGLDAETARAVARDAMGADPWDTAAATYEPLGMRPSPAPAPADVGAPRESALRPSPAPSAARAAAEAAGRAVRRVENAAKDLKRASEQLGAALSADTLHPQVSDAALKAIQRIVDTHGPAMAAGRPLYDAAYDADAFDMATRPDRDTDLFEPGADDFVDHRAAIDAMGDRLLYGVSRVGWSPRLRRLAAAWRKAMREAYEAEKEWAATPSVELTPEAWSELKSAMAGLVGQPRPASVPQPDHPQAPGPRR